MPVNTVSVGAKVTRDWFQIGQRPILPAKPVVDHVALKIGDTDSLALVGDLEYLRGAPAQCAHIAHRAVLPNESVADCVSSEIGTAHNLPATVDPVGVPEPATKRAKATHFTVLPNKRRLRRNPGSRVREIISVGRAGYLSSIIQNLGKGIGTPERAQ